MKCREALNRLSLLLDCRLEPPQASEVSRHLDRCPGCRGEYERLSMLQARLQSLERVQCPEYLPDLVHIRLASASKETFLGGVRSALEYRWSRIRTTEAIWYWTRALGTISSFLFFFVIYSVLNQFYVGLQAGPLDRGGMSQAESQQVVQIVLKNLGMQPVTAQKKPIGATSPGINGLYLLSIGQDAMKTAQDGTFSVVTAVDRMGSARIQDVLEYPADGTLLAEFTNMISSARCRPARLNGRAVDSFLVLTFSKISVYE
jgi:hypothetical protein